MEGDHSLFIDVIINS